MRIAAIAALTVMSALPLAAEGIFDHDDCRYSAPHRASTPAAGITKVVIRAESGSLEVTGVPGAAQISASGTACTSDEDFLGRMNMTLRKAGSELHIDVNIPDKHVVFGFFYAKIDFTVTLPAGLPVEIEDGSGWMKVSNTGAVKIDDGSGSMELRNIRGDVFIDDGSGAIEVDAVTGNLEIDDNSGSLTVRNVSGNVEIDDNSGAITVARVEGSLHVRDDGSGSITAENIRRDVTIDRDGSGGIEVADVGGNFTVGHKGSGGIDYVRVAGKVAVPSRR